MVEKETIKTEIDIIRELKTKFYRDYHRFINMSKAKEQEIAKLKSSNASEQSIKMMSEEFNEMILCAQVSMYSFNSIYHSKSLKELVKSRELLVKSATNFGKRYNSDLSNLNTNISHMTSADIEKINSKLQADRRKFFLLKEAISTIDNTLKNSIEKTSQEKEDSFSYADVEKRLAVLHSQVYELKLELTNVDPNNKTQYDSLLNRLNQAETLREEALSMLIDREDARVLLSEVSAKENNAVKAYNTNRRETYTLSKNTFKKKINEINRKLSDLRFKGTKSKTFKQMHLSDNKLDRVTLSKDIVNLTEERRDIIKSSLGETSGVLKLESRASSLEPVYNLDGGYHAFLSVGGKVCGVNKNKKMYQSGLKSLVTIYKDINDSLNEAFQRNNNIDIKCSLPTYISEIEKRDLAYQKMFSDVLRIRKGYEIKKQNSITRKKEEIRKKLEQIKNRNFGNTKYEPYKVVLNDENNFDLGATIYVNGNQVDEEGKPLPYDEVMNNTGRSM